MFATLTKTAEALPMGEYRSTGLDARKAMADVHILEVYSRGYSICSRNALHGRGLTLNHAIEGSYHYFATDAALDRLHADPKLIVVADF